LRIVGAASSNRALVWVVYGAVLALNHLLGKAVRKRLYEGDDGVFLFH
jgi:hypothetical protein